MHGVLCDSDLVWESGRKQVDGQGKTVLQAYDEAISKPWHEMLAENLAEIERLTQLGPDADEEQIARRDAVLSYLEKTYPATDSQSSLERFAAQLREREAYDVVYALRWMGEQLSSVTLPHKAITPAEKESRRISVLKEPEFIELTQFKEGLPGQAFNSTIEDLARQAGWDGAINLFDAEPTDPGFLDAMKRVAEWPSSKKNEYKEAAREYRAAASNVRACLLDLNSQNPDDAQSQTNGDDRARQRIIDAQVQAAEKAFCFQMFVEHMPDWVGDLVFADDASMHIKALEAEHKKLEPEFQESHKLFTVFNCKDGEPGCYDKAFYREQLSPFYSAQGIGISDFADEQKVGPSSVTPDERVGNDKFEALLKSYERKYLHSKEKKELLGELRKELLGCKDEEAIKQLQESPEFKAKMVQLNTHRFNVFSTSETRSAATLKAMIKEQKSFLQEGRSADKKQEDAPQPDEGLSL